MKCADINIAYILISHSSKKKDSTRDEYIPMCQHLAHSSVLSIRASGSVILWHNVHSIATSVRPLCSERASDLSYKSRDGHVVALHLRNFWNRFRIWFYALNLMYEVSKVSPLAKDKNRTSICEKRGSTKTVICTTVIFSGEGRKGQLFKITSHNDKELILTVTVMPLKSSINTPWYSLLKVAETIWKNSKTCKNFAIHWSFIILKALLPCEQSSFVSSLWSTELNSASYTFF